MSKKICSLILVIAMILSTVLCLSSCDDNIPEYEDHEFMISALWAPRDVSEEGFELYKQAGFNTLSFSNHDEMPRTTDNQYYLGSNRTMEALKLCKKVGLNAILGYGDTWFVREIEGEDYFDGTPFSNYDYYDEYKDIIKGIKIKDEPSKEHIDKYKSKTLTDDFKKVYPNAVYDMTITPRYAGASNYGFDTYDEMLNYYAENIMSQFDNPFISIDYYPFSNEEHNSYPRRDDWLITFEMAAKIAKEYDAQFMPIMQSSAGLEFANELTEADMRLQVNVALAFGADSLQYYCYSVPTIQYTYNYCILDPENKPSALYGYVQDIHKEIQSYADVILSYEWDSVIGTNPVGFSSNMDMSKLLLQNEFKDTQHFEKAISSTNLVISRFTSDKYGEAYMLVNYAEKDKNNIATVTFKDCSKIAVYGGNGFDGTPEIVELDEENQYRVDLAYGEGVFVVPIV